MEEDPIQKLLQSTGWSLEDLLKKVQSRKDPILDVSATSTEGCNVETSSTSKSGTSSEDCFNGLDTNSSEVNISISEVLDVSANTSACNDVKSLHSGCESIGTKVETEPDKNPETEKASNQLEPHIKVEPEEIITVDEVVHTKIKVEVDDNLTMEQDSAKDCDTTTAVDRVESESVFDENKINENSNTTSLNAHKIASIVTKGVPEPIENSPVNGRESQIAGDISSEDSNVITNCQNKVMSSDTDMTDVEDGDSLDSAISSSSMFNKTRKKSAVRCKIEEQLQSLRNNKRPLLEKHNEGLSNTTNAQSPIKKSTAALSLIDRLCARIVEKQPDLQETDDKQGKLLNYDSGIETNSTNSSVSDYKVVSERSPIKLSKTEDKTKIKGWKNKRFESPPPPAPKTQISEVEPITGSTSSDTTYSVPCTAQEGSAFISDSLDEFLTESSPLRISYEVPKLKVEETIGANPDDPVPSVPIHPRVAMRGYRRIKGAVRVGNKPKTLAEKRKLLAKKYKDELELLRNAENATEQQKVQYRRLFERLLTKNQPFTKQQFSLSSLFSKKRSHVEYNNMKLKVVSQDKSEVVAKIYHSKTNHALPLKKRLLLNMPQTLLGKIPFKPGPLCKKSDLQIRNSDSEWSTEVKPVPRVSLIVTPKCEKRVHYKAQLFIKFREDGQLTEDQISFALSALKTKDLIEPRSFTFPVQFARDQEQMVLLRRINNTEVANVRTGAAAEETDEQIRDVVTTVVDKLLDCVEISNMNSVINYDDSADCPKEDHAFMLEDGAPLTKRGQPRRFNRLELELRRLNCRYFEVDVEQDKKEVIILQTQYYDDKGYLVVVRVVLFGTLSMKI